MITYTSSNNMFTVSLQADDISSGGYANHFRAYKGGNVMMRVTRSTQVACIYSVVLDNVGYKYYSDKAGRLTIPIRGYLDGVGASPIVFQVGLADISDPYTFLDYASMYVSAVDGVMYGENPAPIEKGVNEWSWTKSHDAVLPPNVMFSPAGGTGVIVETNMALALQNGVTASEVVAGTATNLNPTGGRGNQLIVDETVDALQLADKTVAHTWTFDRGGDCLDMAVVLWVSLTGAIRKHYFPVVGYLKGGEGGVGVVTSADGVGSVRGATLGVRCRITGLTPYSVWYYADLLQASHVHASLDVSETSLADDDTAADVVETSADVALANGFYTFDLTLNMRRYDKI